MDEASNAWWTAFAGTRRIGSGTPAEVVLAVKGAVDGGESASVLVFDDTGSVVDVDLRGTDAEVVARLGGDGGRTVASGIESAPAAPAESAAGEESPYRESLTPRGRGRPRLGVVAREVTLLPRHWEWLGAQPGGASAAVRRLVDAARQSHAEKDRLRHATESAYRFMSAMAGDEPGFEEATRALFARNEPRFTEMTEEWPRDVRDQVRSLAARTFS